MELITSLIVTATLVILLVVFFNTIKRFFAWAGRNRAALVLSGCCVILVPVFLYFFYTPPATDIGPKQPIAFSHRLHAGVKAIQCQFCHPYVGRSLHPGLPPVEKCLYCHNYIIANFPEILKEHRYYNAGMPTPWVKANYLPEHVLFNHQRHIRKEIECVACHGEVREQDRIKGKRFLMGFCVQCHREKQGPLDCWLACHN
jgi:hypothetical protein